MVWESTTKWLHGSGTTIGGVLVDGGTFPWEEHGYDEIAGANPAYHGVDFRERFGDAAFAMAARARGVGVPRRGVRRHDHLRARRRRRRSYAAARDLCEATDLASLLANVGDAKTLIIHPASTTHQQLTEEEQRASGVTPEMVRLSVGIEDPDDVIADLDAAIEAVR